MTSSRVKRGELRRRPAPFLFDREAFQLRLKEKMLELGIKDGSALARRTGLSQPQCSRLLSEDDFRIPTGETLLRIAVKLSMSIDKLVALAEVSRAARDSEPPPSAVHPSSRPAAE